jgi:hypothetical protein
MLRRLVVASMLVSMLPVLALAQWGVVYATSDDELNGTGNRTAGVAVIHENMFIALVTRYANSTYQTNYMIPYVDADSALGRKYTYGYGAPTANVFEIWSDGAFDQIPIQNCQYITATPDSFIYVPSNDAVHNLLVFKYASDTITVVPVNGVYPREETGLPSVYGVAVDQPGNVYVCVDTTNGNTVDVKVYPPIGQWDAGHQTPALQTIDLPDGIYKGIAVSPDGKSVFVSDYAGRKVLKYKGSVATGYSLDGTFNFALGLNDTMEAFHVGPLGLQILMPNNILLVSCASQFSLGSYSYGRTYLLNPNTGALISPDSSMSVVDEALWNLTFGGDYTNQEGGQLAGYASVYAVQTDEKGYLYTNSYYGWAIEKWAYNGTLPVITSVQPIQGAVPESYLLRQNYPNPFNPATTIEFAVPKESDVRIAIVNMLGEEVALLVNDSRPAGQYRVVFDGSALASGTYFCIMKSGSFTESRKLMLLK